MLSGSVFVAQFELPALLNDPTILTTLLARLSPTLWRLLRPEHMNERVNVLPFQPIVAMKDLALSGETTAPRFCAGLSFLRVTAARPRIVQLALNWSIAVHYRVTLSAALSASLSWLLRCSSRR